MNSLIILLRIDSHTELDPVAFHYLSRTRAKNQTAGNSGSANSDLYLYSAVKTGTLLHPMDPYVENPMT